MNCQKCNSNRVVSINAKSSDLNYIKFGEKKLDGYVPSDLGIGGGDYVDMKWCLDCGQIQGDFPLPEAEIEETETETEETEETEE